MNYRILLVIYIATSLILSTILIADVNSKVRVIVTIDKKVFKLSNIEKLGGIIIKKFDIIPAIVVELPKSALEALKKSPGVVRVEYDTIVYALGGKPNNKGKGRPQPPQVIPWGIERIGAPTSWTLTNGSADSNGDGDYEIEVAVLDTGVDKDHPDLLTNIKWGICVVGDKVSTEPRDWNDRNGHGTHVTGIIAAINNDIGVVGVAPEVEIYAIKVLNDAGYGYWSDVIEGIEWALKGPDGIVDSNGDGVIVGDPDDDAAEVISMSFGASSAPEAVHDAIRIAYDYGVVLVAAAGNEGELTPCYPAAYDEVIAVGAIDESDNVPSWSNKNPELVAPGVNILSTYKNDGYEELSGTSMACPHVSGTVALVQAVRLANGMTILSPGDVRKVLRDTADDLGDPGYDSLYGYGVVRADKAVSESLNYP